MIFEYCDYKIWLKDELEKKAKFNPHFSANAFAKKIGISQPYLSYILNGKRRLTLKLADVLCEKLNINIDERKYLHLLIKKEIENDLKTLKFFESEMKILKQKHQLNKLNLEVFKIISDWQYSAIWESFNVVGCDGTIESISIITGIKENIVHEHLLRLIRVGIVKQKNKYIFELTKKGIHSTPNEIRSEALRTFHKQALSKAVLAVDEQEIEKRTFNGMTMAINPNKINEAKAYIQKAIGDLNALLQEGERTKLYQLEIALFELRE